MPNRRGRPKTNMMQASVAPVRRSWNWWLLCGVMFFSGAAALGYELVWIRMFATGLGHEMPAAVAVICAFLAGLALGAWLLDRPIRESPTPLAWYAGLEIIIGVWALVSIVSIAWMNSRIGQLTGIAPGPLQHWAVAFAVPLVMLLPATMAMGATLPAVDRLMEGIRRDGRSIGAIYAANTLGAVAGTLGATHLLVPAWGLRITVLVLAGINFCCALVAWRGLTSETFERTEVPGPRTSSMGRTRLIVTLLLTGLLGIGYEVLGTRVMAQVLENTVYSFASVLSMYLLGTSLGAALYQRYLRDVSPDRLLTMLLGGLCIACLGGVWVLSHAAEIHRGLLVRFGSGLRGAILAEMGLALAVFGLPTVLMGATFSSLAQSFRDHLGSVGRGMAVNTLGGALAAPVFAVALLPWWGAKWTLIAVCLGYLALLPRLPPKWLLLGSAMLLVIAGRSELQLVQPLSGGSVLAYREGVMASVAVVTDKDGDRYLKVNDRFRMGGTAAPSHERRLAHIPLLLHPQPRRALFLGIGTGNTAAAALAHDGLHVDAVELLPEVIALQPYFESTTGDLQSRESLQIFASDARRFVQSARDSYDVIVADLFHPARDGSGSLYTREHFRAVRGRLTPEGLFCQWLPLYQLSDDSLRVIVHTFLDMFPHGRAFFSNFDVQMPVLGLVGSAHKPLVYPGDWFEQRMGDEKLLAKVRQTGITNGFSLFGLFAGSEEFLQELSGDGSLNTDDLPVITFHAPRFVYGHREPAYEHVLRILDAGDSSRSHRFVQDGEYHQRLFAYLAARDRFLRAEVDRVRGEPAQALEGYLAAVEASPDFDLAYTVVLMHARQHATAGQLVRAEELLKRITRAHPARADGRAMLKRIRDGAVR